MADAPRVFVIGGGPAGLRAACSLQTQGAAVTLLEAAPVLGGLASSFETEGTLIERYYHFVCKPDQALIDLMTELGMADKVRWIETRMGFYFDGKMYEWGRPDLLLRFPGLSIINKLRN